jgi:hypothetical protein
MSENLRHGMAKDDVITVVNKAIGTAKLDHGMFSGSSLHLDLGNIKEAFFHNDPVFNKPSEEKIQEQVIGQQLQQKEQRIKELEKQFALSQPIQENQADIIKQLQELNVSLAKGKESLLLKVSALDSDQKKHADEIVAKDKRIHELELKLAEVEIESKANMEKIKQSKILIDEKDTLLAQIKKFNDRTIIAVEEGDRTRIELEKKLLDVTALNMSHLTSVVPRVRVDSLQFEHQSGMPVHVRAESPKLLDQKEEEKYTTARLKTQKLLSKLRFAVVDEINNFFLRGIGSKELYDLAKLLLTDAVTVSNLSTKQLVTDFVSDKKEDDLLTQINNILLGLDLPDTRLTLDQQKSQLLKGDPSPNEIINRVIVTGRFPDTRRVKAAVGLLPPIQVAGLSLFQSASISSERKTPAPESSSAAAPCSAASS